MIKVTNIPASVKKAPITNSAWAQLWSQLNKITLTCHGGEFVLYSQNHLLVARLDRKIVGYLIYNIEDKQLHVVELGVSKTHRRIGVGRNLIEKVSVCALKFAKKTVVVKTNSDYDALGFYEKCGFKLIQVRNGPHQKYYRLHKLVA